MQKIPNDFTRNIFLFKGMESERIENLMRETEYTVKEFSKGDIVFSPSSGGNAIGFIIDGTCEVSRLRMDDNPVPLNTLKKHSSFGIISIFSKDEEFPTVIKAKSKSTVLFFDEPGFVGLVRSDSTVALNVIAFLCGKISFLNEKIATFSEKSTRAKLCAYLYSQYKQGYTEISGSATKLSMALGIGRASLYRDIAALEKEDTIKLENKKIIIKDPLGLERNAK